MSDPSTFGWGGRSHFSLPSEGRIDVSVMNDFRLAGAASDGFQLRDNPLAPTDKFRPSTMSTTPYVPPVDPRVGLCEGNDNTCKAHPSKGTKLCYGHLKRLAKEQKEAADAAE